MLPREYVGLFSGKCEKLSFGSEIHEKITEKLKNIRTESRERRMGYEIVVRSLLCEALAELMRASERASALVPVRAGASRPSESLCAMDRAMDHINSHLDQPLTLAELARVAGFGRTYFSTLFSELNGLSPWEYIRIRRIERAKSLLAATDLSVLEVSERSGFSNLSNFNRAFLAGVGMTPREYRKEHRVR
jgi:AraC family transcriptional regulator